MFSFCEENLPTLIKEPSNTISGLVFLIIGFLILKKDKLIGLGTIFVGLTTIFYHATNSLIGQNFDLFSMLILLIIFLYKSKPFKNINTKFLIIGVILFTIAFLFWLGDITKTLCVPQNHILTGHSIWHILTAIGILYFYKALPKK